MEKRGVSDVITTVLIILLVLAAVAIIGGIILKNLGDASEKIEAGFNTVSLSVPLQSVKVDPAIGLINLNVQRNAGQGNVKAFNVILEDSSGQRKVIRVDQPIAELETKSVNVRYSGLIDVKKISVSPIIQTSKGSEFQAEILTTTQLSGSEPIAIPQGIVGYWKFDEASGTTASDSSGNSQTAALVSSGELVKDGGAELNNKDYNWVNWDGVSSDKFFGNYSFTYMRDTTTTIFSNEFIPIEVTNEYNLSGRFKDIKGYDKYKIYFGYKTFDENKIAFRPQDVDVVLGTETKLVKDAKIGDTAVYIEDNKNWVVLLSSGNPYAVVAFNVDDSGGYTDLPNRDWQSYISKIEDESGVWKVMLTKPLSKSYNMGTKIREQKSGGTYMYEAAAYNIVKNNWMEYSAKTKGESLHSTIKGQWRPGTKYVQLIILPNYDRVVGDQLFGDEISVRSAPASYTGPLQIAGKIGKALQFDGYDDYAEITDSDNLDLTDKFTIAFWVKRESGTGLGVISKDGGGDTTGAYNIYITSNGNVQYEVNNRATISSTATIPIDQWYYVAVTFDNSLPDKKLKIYINGVEAGSGNPVQPSVLDTDLLVGKRGIGAYFKGTIDELTIYKKTLSGEEVSGLYTLT